MTGPFEPSVAGPATDTARYRQVLGHYPTGVVVVTGRVNRAAAGLAIGSFTSLSLEPPLVLFCVAKDSTSWPPIAETGVFCANVLAEDQEHVARLFSTRGADRFTGLGWHSAPRGSPILEGVLSWIECSIERVDEGGDHWVVLGRVTGLDVVREAPPLVFFRGGYGRYTP
jgi:3-hydroxy-9,10-secoandrosta-1,3,5(10)-triene-9,17-dione monooxygenase reductase component